MDTERRIASLESIVNNMMVIVFGMFIAIVILGVECGNLRDTSTDVREPTTSLKTKYSNNE